MIISPIRYQQLQCMRENSPTSHAVSLHYFAILIFVYSTKVALADKEQ